MSESATVSDIKPPVDSRSTECPPSLQDDEDGENHPNRKEDGDSADNNCDGVIDEGAIFPTLTNSITVPNESRSVSISSGSEGTIAIMPMVDDKVILDIATAGSLVGNLKGELVFNLENPDGECPYKLGTELSGSRCKFVEMKYLVLRESRGTHKDIPDKSFAFRGS